MNFKTLVAAFAMTLALASPALAASFSFNKATADQMVAGAKSEGVTLPKAMADAIVKYRTEKGPFAEPRDLAKVPGIDIELMKKLAPAKANGDVVSKGAAAAAPAAKPAPAAAADDEPGMKAY